MQQLIEAVHRFQRETFGNSRELLNPPAPNGQQRPALLIIGLLAVAVVASLLHAARHTTPAGALKTGAQ